MFGGYLWKLQKKKGYFYKFPTEKQPALVITKSKSMAMNDRIDKNILNTCHVYFTPSTSYEQCTSY